MILDFGWNYLRLKILPGGLDVVLLPGSAENAAGKGPGFNSDCGAPIQNIFFYFEDDEHKENYKDDEDNEDDEDENVDDDNKG